MFGTMEDMENLVKRQKGDPHYHGLVLNHSR